MVLRPLRTMDPVSLGGGDKVVVGKGDFAEEDADASRT